MRAALVAGVLCGALTLAACGNDSGSGASAGTHATTTTTADPAAFRPTAKDHDPSRTIPGVEVREYTVGLHVQSPQRVAYDESPPFGGAHDAVWAACNGVVYRKPVRNENMVHTLEHGAVWIAYNPDVVRGAALDALSAKVADQTYLSVSPYPGLDKPVSLQAWGHRLKVGDVGDPRVDEFIVALRLNPYTTPELGASCDQTPDYFDPDDPPPFDPSPPGADAVPVNGTAGGKAGSPSSTG